MDSRLEKHPLGYWKVKNIPDSNSLRKYYEDRYYQTNQGNYRVSYSAEEREWFDIRIARIAAAIATIRSNSKGALLDVGCGEGFAMNWFSKNGWSVKGLDYSITGISAMNYDLLPNITPGDVMENLSALEIQNNRFDLIWLTNVLEHVPEPLTLLKNLRKLITNGGVAVVTVPNDGTDLQEFLYQNSLMPERSWIAIPDHLAYFDKDSLKNIAEVAGWECKHVFAEFPIDWFLANKDSNYYADKSKGSAAHTARITLDTILSKQPISNVNNFYEAMANVGMGRQLTAILI